MAKEKKIQPSTSTEPRTVTAPDLDKRQLELLKFQGEGFDLRSRVIDPKTGKILRHQPYRMVIGSPTGDYFLRDGKRYSLSGTEISTPSPAA